jgi:hypothetical protein
LNFFLNVQSVSQMTVAKQLLTLYAMSLSWQCTLAFFVQHVLISLYDKTLRKLSYLWCFFLIFSLSKPTFMMSNCRVKILL